MMKRLYALFPLLIALLMPTGAWADVWQDPETKVNYEYTPGQSEAGVKAGMKGLAAGSPEATGDVNILSAIFVDGKEYTITSIGEAAFSATNITSVHIPPTIQEIGDGAWGDCYSLKKIYISDLAAWCNIRFETGFANGFWTGAHLYLNDEEISELFIPDGVTTIKYAAFMLLDNLSSVTIPCSVTTIEIGAFMCRSELQKVVSYIEEPFDIDEHTFYKIIMPRYFPTDMQACNATLYVPAGTKAKYEAAEGWKEFKNIVEMTPYNVLDDNTVAAHFLEPDENGKVEIPETVEIDGKTYTVTEIAADAFRNNEELTEVTIPGSVTTIGDGAFAGCENLRAIYVYAPEPISLTADEARSLMTRATENVPSQLEGIDFDACILYVPIGSEQKYREAEGWKLFTHIVGVEDPSGIATVYTEKNDYGAVYNLSGQRLAAPQKGLNIVDGRKVVMK